MSFIERRNEPRPDSGEAPFGLDEVFFSRTDLRGVIKAGNYIFRRVAGFDWPEMLGAPHKLIRHPDMPRAVFWLLWDRIQKGKPVGAYVKNRAKDGLYYWVYAIVVPCKDCYLSARFKPSSEMREVVEAEYAALRRAENQEGLSPEESAGRLLKRLGEMGFENYEAFATQAMNQELAARDAGLGRKSAETRLRYSNMLKEADALREQTDALVHEFGSTHTIPHNMRVIGSRLEPTGGPISVLSKNYAAISAEMSNWFETNVVGENSNFATIVASVNTALFLDGMVRILSECDAQLRIERRSLGDVDMEVERGYLRGIVAEQALKSRCAIERVRQESERILRACETMERHVLELSSTRVLCKIESARVPGAGDALGDIIVQLKGFQERIDAQLERISVHSREILSLAEPGAKVERIDVKSCDRFSSEPA